MNNKCNYFVTISLLRSEISLKSHEKPGNLLKFVCVTFAQYCDYQISLKSHEKPGNLLKFVCVTFAQYCDYHNYVCLLPRLRANYQMEALMTGNLSALLTLSQVAKQ